MKIEKREKIISVLLEKGFVCCQVSQSSSVVVFIVCQHWSCSVVSVTLEKLVVVRSFLGVDCKKYECCCIVKSLRKLQVLWKECFCFESPIGFLKMAKLLNEMFSSKTYII